MNLVLIGMKHCGKSTQGRALAAILQRRFIDSDEALERLYAEKHHESLPTRQIFQKLGREGFRRLEGELLDRLAADVPDNAVIALGGGTPDNPYAAAALTKLGCLVYLEVAPEIIYPRIVANGLPPFLDAVAPRESFARLYRQRAERYRAVAACRVPVQQEAPPEQLTQRLLALLKDRL